MPDFDPPQPGDAAVADDVVRRIRENPTLTGDRFLARPGPAEAIMPGVMYRYPEVTGDRQIPVVLTIFIGVGTLGAALWQQEVAAIERIGGLGGGALPELLDSGYLERDGQFPGATFVRTRSADPVMVGGNSAAVAEVLHAHRGEALRQLWLLADALDVIHDCRIVHRNIGPQSVQMEFSGDAKTADDLEVRLAGMHMQLTRFEMSGMVSNMLRVWRAGRAGPDDVRRFMLSQPPRSRVFAAPERLRFMFSDGKVGAQDFSGDVFGLGMLAVEWLLGPTTLGTPDDWNDLAALEALQRRVRTALATSDLPTELQKLLGDMISDSANRPSAREVVTMLGRVYGASLVDFGAEETPLAPYLIAFMPGSTRTDTTLYRWGYLSTSTDEPEGVDELAELVQSDTRGGRILYSPDGAAPFVFDANEADSRQAQTVIAGHEFIWFLKRMFKPQGLGGRIDFDEIQIIQYVVERSRMAFPLQEFLRSSLSRVMHDVEAVNFDDDTSIHLERAARHPTWIPVIKSLKVRAPAPAGAVDRQRAMEWYVDYQNAVQRGREYAYKIVDASVPGRPQIVADEDAENERALSTTDSLVRYVLSDIERLPLRDFILRAQEDGGNVELVFAELGSRLRSGVVATVNSLRGDRNIVIATEKPIPAQGWLRLSDDNATAAQIRNQQEAVGELSKRRDLLNQLASPHSVPRSRFRWGPEVAGNLVGEGAAVVREMLAHETLFVLQGPPGTGKTTITSHAIAAFLTREHGARILISAQSHDALDNLAERILDLLKLEWNGSNGLHTALRIAGSTRKGSVSKRMQRYLEADATKGFVESIQANARRNLSGAQRRSPELAAVIEEWLGSVERLGLDLRLRLRRGANLIFATTGASTPLNLVTRGSNEPFDWVVIEEAARAWPSELALPMVRGARWTLIGDQAQISAYGQPQIRRLLDNFEHDPDPDLQALWAQRATLATGFELFASFFDGEEASWRHTLKEQHRMDERIAKIVSKTFYKESGGLSSPGGRRAHGLEHPEWLADEAIVWIDTGGRHRAVPSWSNDDEARDVAALVRRIAPELEQARKTIAVLTPYRSQVTQLTKAMFEREHQIFTIDGYQGREADVIVASLVRDQVWDPLRPWTNAGHLTDPGRANVLMSRARALLIVVGDLSLFEHDAGDDWAEMVRTIRKHGAIVSLEDAGLS